MAESLILRGLNKPYSLEQWGPYPVLISPKITFHQFRSFVVFLPSGYSNITVFAVQVKIADGGFPPAWT